MKFLMVSVALAALVSFPAQAQDGAIRVVNPDGSVTVFELPAYKAAPPQPEPEPDAAPKTASVPSARDLIEPDAPQIDESGEEPRPAKVHVTKAPVPKAAPKPAREPQLREAESIGRGTRGKGPAVDPGTPITADLALRIALEEAPPASKVNVAYTTYKDRPVYMVTFKTEAGPHDVLVDANTGEVVDF